jgi:ferredoxin-NADP reductase
LFRHYTPYAIVVGLLYSVNKLRLSPEEALLLGNLFAFLIAPKRKFAMRFLRRVQEADGIYSYLFEVPKNFRFVAGQYMEWTLAQHKSDQRGNRRYLTLSSSPTENQVMFTVKFPPDKPSAFKQQLTKLIPGETMLAGDLAGSFTLPKNKGEKLALMAGGVGITPFRSMIKFMADESEKRDVALLYSAARPAEFSFQNLFKEGTKTGLKTILVTSTLDDKKIGTLLPDYGERTFYISGPYGYVQAMHNSLLKLGISGSKIVTDYFPGYG